MLEINDIDKEAIRVEQRAACEALNMAAIAMAMASISPVGSDSWQHYTHGARKYLSDVVRHINEVGLLSGQIDVKDPANALMQEAHAKAEWMREQPRKPS